MYVKLAGKFFDVSHIVSLLCNLFALLAAITSAGAISLRVKGPPSVVVQLKSGRTVSGHSTLLQIGAPLSLWCQAVDANTYEVIPADEISFRHNAHRLSAKFTDDSHRNATLVREQVTVEDVGRWTCYVRTRTHGNATGDIMVYMRPVVNTSLRVDDRSSSKFYFDLSSMTVIDEETVRLDCPVVGNPKPTIIWRKNNHDIHTVRDARISTWDNVLEIRNATKTDAGTYSCIATNVISHKGEKQSFEVRADRSLRVKSKYAWVAPLTIIAVIVTLLITTIVLCEFRKRRSQPKLLGPEED